MNAVRVGIIGYGGMGGAHAEYLANGEVPNAVLTAVCDTSPDRLKAAREHLGERVQLFGDAEALFAAQAVDGVMIATPHYDHPPLARLAFRHGCHVLCEKPAGVYTKQVKEMNAAAARSGKVFALMFNQRTLLSHQKLRELVVSGEIGELRRVSYFLTSWFRSQFYYDSGQWRATWAGEGGGVLINQCPHNLDLLQWITGMPKRARAFCEFGKHHNIEVEDEVTAFLEYPNGATGLFVTSTGEAPGTNRFEIAGDRGKVVLEEGKITFWRTRIPVSRFLRESKQAFQAPECWKCEIAGGAGDGHRGVTSSWVNAILKGTPLLARGEEGLASLELSNAMLLSSWTDSWVEIPVDEDLFLRHLQEKVKTSKFKKPAAAGGLDFKGSYGV